MMEGLGKKVKLFRSEVKFIKLVKLPWPMAYYYW